MNIDKCPNCKSKQIKSILPKEVSVGHTDILQIYCDMCGLTLDLVIQQKFRGWYWNTPHGIKIFKNEEEERKNE